MKQLHFILFYTLCVYATAQIEVETITTDFKGSGGLSLDIDGNLYIGDFGDMLGGADIDGEFNDVLKLDTDYNLSQFSTGFLGASGNGFDNNGILYQSDIRDNAVFKIVDGVRTLVTSDNIFSPVGIVFDSDDNFYVCNCGSNTIRKVTPDGVSTLFASGALFNCPNGITIDTDNNLYVSNFFSPNIVKITPDGTPNTIGNTTAGNGHLDYDPNSRNLYIASYEGNQIFSLNIDTQEMNVIAGTGVRGNDDGLGSEATFSTPNGIAVSQDGLSIYVNCAVPLSGDIINPQIIRKITGITLSIENNDISSYQIEAYPNPSKNEITIKTNTSFPYSDLMISIYDLQGSLVKKEPFTASKGVTQTINISKFQSGSYLYKISHKSKQLFSGKFLKN